MGVAVLTLVALGGLRQPAAARPDDAGTGPRLRLLLVGGERGTLVAGHGAPGPARWAAQLEGLASAGDAARLLGTGGHLDVTTPAAARLAAEHVRALLGARGAIGMLLAGAELQVPAAAQGWRGEGPLGEPTPPLNVLLAPSHPASGRTGWLDVEVAGFPLRVLGLLGERDATALRDDGLARAWIAPATALQNLLPAPERIWLAVADADAAADLAALRRALARLGPSVLVVRGDDATARGRLGGDEAVLVGQPAARDGLLVLTLTGGVGQWEVEATHRPPDLAPDEEAQGPGAVRDVALLEAIWAGRLAAAAPVGEVPVRSAQAARHVGSAICAACHAAIASEPLVTTHAQALQRLAGTPGMHDPSCLSCHATGWLRGPHGPARAPDGFRTPESTPWLAGVGCEACHGEGSTHLLDPWRHGSLARRPAQACLTCHDAAVDPAFAAQAAEAAARVHATIAREDRTRVPAAWRARLHAAGRGPTGEHGTDGR